MRATKPRTSIWGCNPSKPVRHRIVGDHQSHSEYLMGGASRECFHRFASFWHSQPADANKGRPCLGLGRFGFWTLCGQSLAETAACG
jgi:hypothetical protein